MRQSTTEDKSEGQTALSEIEAARRGSITMSRSHLVGKASMATRTEHLGTTHCLLHRVVQAAKPQVGGKAAKPRWHQVVTATQPHVGKSKNASVASGGKGIKPRPSSSSSSSRPLVTDVLGADFIRLDPEI